MSTVDEYAVSGCVWWTRNNHIDTQIVTFTNIHRHKHTYTHSLLHKMNFVHLKCLPLRTFVVAFVNINELSNPHALRMKNQ